MKLLIFQLFTLLGAIYFIPETSGEVPMYWSELDIINQIRLILGISLMIALALAAVVIFRSVWVKNGYAGLDQILVDKEVALFMSHVLAFALLEVFIFMNLFYNYVQPPSYAFWICAAGFLSPEVVQGLHFIMDMIRNKKDK
jgi:hypothetical protein